MDATQCYCVCANAVSGLPDYLLLPAPLLPVLLLPLLDLPDDFEEKSLVMNSETSGSSWLEFSIFIDCSISCGKTKHIAMKGTEILQVIQQLILPLRKEERNERGTGSEQWRNVTPNSISKPCFMPPLDHSALWSSVNAQKCCLGFDSICVFIKGIFSDNGHTVIIFLPPYFVFWLKYFVLTSIFKLMLLLDALN